jgi:hypothetical protein
MLKLVTGNQPPTGRIIVFLHSTAECAAAVVFLLLSRKGGTVMFESDTITEFMSAFDEKLEGYPEQIEEFISSKQ